MASLLNNITNGAYVTTIKVGSPEQTLTLQVDTGSSDTWLPSTQAQICQTGGCFFGSCKPSSHGGQVRLLTDEMYLRSRRPAAIHDG